MTAHKATTQGRRFQIGTMTDLETPSGTYVDIRVNDATALPHKTTQAYKPPTGGHTNPADTAKPVDYKDGSQTGVVELMVRRGTTTLEPAVGKLLRAAGWNLDETASKTTVDTGTTTTSLVCAADNSTEVGMGVSVEMDDGKFEPVLAATWSPSTAVPLIAMSADPTDGNDIQKMFTYTPRVGPITETDLVALRELSRVEDGSSNKQEFTHYPCGAQLQDITISPNGTLVFGFDVQMGDTGIDTGTWDTDDFKCREEVVLNDGSMECILVEGNATTGGLTRTQLCLLGDAVISAGLVTTKTPCIGGTNVNSIGGYAVAQPGDSGTVITLQALFDRAMIDHWETVRTGGSGTNPDHALVFSWSGADINHPAVMIAFPRVRLVDCPETQTTGSDSGLVQATFVLEATGASMGGDKGPTESGDRRMYIGIGGELT